MFNLNNIKEIKSKRDNIFEPFPSKSLSDETISIQSIKDYINSEKYKKDKFLYEKDSYLFGMDDMDEIKAEFFLMDYEKYSSILNSFKIKDDIFRKEKLEEIQKEIPTLYNSKKFKKNVGLELDNRIILNPKINQEAQQKLLGESIKFSIIEADDFRFADEHTKSGYSLFSPSFYVNTSNDKIINQFFFLATGIPFKKKEEPNIIQNTLTINDEKNVETIGSIEVSDKGLILFDNYHLQTKDPRDYDELVVNCNKGTYEIKKYTDSIFRENIKKAKEFYSECKDKKLLFEQAKNGDQYGEALVKRDEIFLAKYRVTEPGVCFFFIDFNN